jgi:hypothetical protein
MQTHNNVKNLTRQQTRRSAHQWSVLRGVNPTRMIVGEEEGACRPRQDATWIKPGHQQVRPDLSGPKLWDAVSWMAVRKGKTMTEADQSVLDELYVRAWGWEEVSRRRGWMEPAWLDPLIPPRRKSGYRRCIVVLMAAHRAGAVGVRLGYHEWRALCQVGSEGTWRRWTREMEQRGLIRVQQTWVEDKSTAGRKRCYGKLLYQVGPAVHACARAGILEGLELSGHVKPGQARRDAALARGAARDLRDADREELWEQKNSRGPRHSVPLNCSPILNMHNPLLRRGSVVSPPAGGTEVEKDRAAHVAAFRAKRVARKQARALEQKSATGPAREAKSVGGVTAASSENDQNMGNWSENLADETRALLARLRGLHCVLWFVLAGLLGCVGDLEGIGTTSATSGDEAVKSNVGWTSMIPLGSSDASELDTATTTESETETGVTDSTSTGDETATDNCYGDCFAEILQPAVKSKCADSLCVFHPPAQLENCMISCEELVRVWVQYTCETRCDGKQCRSGYGCNVESGTARGRRARGLLSPHHRR